MSITIQPASVELDANNTYGSITALAASATTTVVNIASSSAGYRVSGMAFTGTGDGYFALQIGGSTVLSGRTDNVERSRIMQLPDPVPVTAGTNVRIRVTNEALLAADYEATLFGV